MLYSILDVKAKHFGAPVECRSDEESIRSFMVTIQNASKTDLIGLYPQDFILFRVGDFDHFTGQLSIEPTPFQLITGLECVQMLKGLNNTSSECSVSNNFDTLHPVKLNGNEEEVGTVKACIHDESESCIPTASCDCSDTAFDLRKDFRES